MTEVLELGRTEHAQAAQARNGARVLAALVAASGRAGCDDIAERLSSIRDRLQGDLTALEAALATCSPDGDPNLGERAAAHLLAKPGKRVRPLCVFLAGAMDADSADRRELLQVAVAGELVHAATLLHDDVIDVGTLRRGGPTARLLFGNPASVLGGDHLLVDALRRIARLDRPRLLDGLLDAITEMIAGEAVQLERRGRFDPDPEAYWSIVDGKTGALFAWCLTGGAEIAGLSGEAVAALDICGRALGRAFQLVDDALDVGGSSIDTGKDALRDVAEGKLTWPLVIACRRDPAILPMLRSAWASGGAFAAETSAELTEALRRTGCAEATRRQARVEGRRALQALERVPDGPPRDALRAVVTAAVERRR